MVRKRGSMKRKWLSVLSLVLGLSMLLPRPAHAQFGEDAAAIITFLENTFINLLVEQTKALLVEKMTQLFQPAADAVNEFYEVKTKFLKWGPFGTVRDGMDVWRELSQGGIDPNAGLVIRSPSGSFPRATGPTGYAGGGFPSGGWSGGWNNPHPGAAASGNGWGSSGGWNNGANDANPTPTPSPTPTPTPTPTPSPTPTPISIEAMNDEFNDSGLDTYRWSKYNLDGYPTIGGGNRTITFAFNSTAFTGRLYDSSHSTGQPGAPLRGVLQPLPTGDLTIIAKVTHKEATANYAQAGLLFSSTPIVDNANPDDKQTAIELGVTEGGYYYAGSQNYLRHGSEALGYAGYGDFAGQQPTANFTVYFRAKRISGVWKIMYSTNGTQWFTQHDLTGVTDPQYVGIFWRFDSFAMGQEFDFDFFRVWSGDYNGDANTLPPPPSAPSVARMVFQSPTIATPYSSGAALGRSAYESMPVSAPIGVTTSAPAAPGGVSSLTGLGDYSGGEGMVMDFRPFDPATHTGTIMGTVRAWVRLALVGLVWAGLLFWVWRALQVRINA